MLRNLSLLQWLRLYRGLYSSSQRWIQHLFDMLVEEIEGVSEWSRHEIAIDIEEEESMRELRLLLCVLFLDFCQSKPLWRIGYKAHRCFDRFWVIRCVLLFEFIHVESMNILVRIILTLILKRNSELLIYWQSVVIVRECFEVKFFWFEHGFQR